MRTEPSGGSGGADLSDDDDGELEDTDVEMGLNKKKNDFSK